MHESLAAKVAGERDGRDMGRVKGGARDGRQMGWLTDTPFSETPEGKGAEESGGTQIMEDL